MEENKKSPEGEQNLVELDYKVSKEYAEQIQAMADLLHLPQEQFLRIVIMYGLKKIKEVICINASESF